MEVSLTELRQRLFELADRVIETGEAIVITRRGRTLRIIRDEVQPKAYSRLAKLRKLGPQPYEIGPPLDPHESPAQWSELEHFANEPGKPYVFKAIGRAASARAEKKAKTPKR
jgi:antitoxin (DNA-binding transcriptional repressor) of toxin-antitoxin stability system